MRTKVPRTYSPDPVGLGLSKKGETKMAITVPTAGATLTLGQSQEVSWEQISGAIQYELWYSWDGTNFLDSGLGRTMSLSCSWLVKAVCSNMGKLRIKGFDGSTSKGTWDQDVVFMPQLLKGDKGDTGDPVETGPQGQQGAAGPQGATGAQGATGPQGATGAQGATGPQGATGLAGLNAPLVQIGVVGADDNDANWKRDMASGEKKPRTWCKNVLFTEEFKDAPKVSACLTHIDIGNNGNAILGCGIENITQRGFGLRFTTFWTAQVHGATATWIAVGEPK
jgi:hypothetical protein